MWINYLKIAFRNFMRRKFFSFINITGLSIGMAASLLIILYIIDEYSYDTFHKDAERIYRVHTRARMTGKDMNTCFSSAPISADLQKEIPEVVDGCRIVIRNDVNIGNENEVFSEKKVLLADSNFFNFFSFRLLHGNPKTALKDPNAIILTESSANKYFGFGIDDKSSLLGKIMRVGMGDSYLITGIAEDPPSNSHFKYNVILSMESWNYSHQTSWIGNNLHNYIKLTESADYHGVEAKFSSLVEKYIGPQIQQVLGISFEQFHEQGGMYGYYLQPLLRIHLHPQTDYQLEPPGNLNIIYLLTAIVFLIILIACINFMNLSTARYTDRVREVAVNKSLGASRRRLIGQFLAESFMITSLSAFLAFIILWSFLPQFNMITDKTLSFSSISLVPFLTILATIIVLISLIAGCYPAFYLTAFSPAEILRGKISSNPKIGNFRSSLVVFQFTMSIMLIISTLLIHKQLNHLQRVDLGFDKENVLVIKNAGYLGENKIAFKEELKKLNDIIQVSIVNQSPPEFNLATVFKTLDDSNIDFPTAFCIVDEDQLSTLDLKMKEGRFFSKAFISDSSSVIINETAAKLLGWEDPIGKKIETYWEKRGSDVREVIGVIKDFHFQSLHEEISSLFIFYGTVGNNMLVRLAPGNQGEKINQIESKWKELASGQPFDFSFIDADFDAKFRKEQQMAKIFSIFTFLAIFIACLGLLGLATFMTEQRSKEFGIRKVMGASNSGIMRLLSLEYLKLIGISFVIAIPLVYMLINWWLDNFIYKTPFGIIPFIAGGGITVLITLMSVSYQSFKAAFRNPVEALRYE
jgi:putative ABC transport system permease protein